jgi:hypothetical protein
MTNLLAGIVWNTSTISVIGAFAVPLIGILALAWYGVHKVRSTNALKRSMVERGMSVDEIERVIAAKDD